MILFDVDVPRGASFLQVKQKIKELMKVEVDRQTLVFETEPMEDASQVPDRAWETYVVLSVAPLPGDPSFEIVAKSANREDDLITVKETQSVDDLRNDIAERWGLSHYTSIFLIRLPAPPGPMENGDLLSDYLTCQGVEILVKLHNA
ncbi:hypothetical protein FNV43_RR01372 [Rhamnella rubrinervis]|uniref:Ubiquitin-like domain-containing protein n=1 Tax=Rhamnella rubrinervis TaxID=2594499 RepID=A0A8K0HSA8_9ROSA|nr:hypothetical protein FNV43_RR01372 [Rhamnella rubrinervis]